MPVGTKLPFKPSTGDTVEKVAALHIVSITLFICGTGLTVMVKVIGVPILDTPPFSKVGVTVIVATNGASVWLTPVNASIIPEPSSVCVKPISSPDAIHEYEVEPPEFDELNTISSVISSVHII